MLGLGGWKWYSFCVRQTNESNRPDLYWDHGPGLVNVSNSLSRSRRTCRICSPLKVTLIQSLKRHSSKQSGVWRPTLTKSFKGMSNFVTSHTTPLLLACIINILRSVEFGGFKSYSFYFRQTNELYWCHISFMDYDPWLVIVSHILSRSRRIWRISSKQFFEAHSQSVW